MVCTVQHSWLLSSRLKKRNYWYAIRWPIAAELDSHVGVMMSGGFITWFETQPQLRDFPFGGKSCSWLGLKPIKIIVALGSLFHYRPTIHRLQSSAEGRELLERDNATHYRRIYAIYSRFSNQNNTSSDVGKCWIQPIETSRRPSRISTRDF